MSTNSQRLRKLMIWFMVSSSRPEASRRARFEAQPPFSRARHTACSVTGNSSPPPTLARFRVLSSFELSLLQPFSRVWTVFDMKLLREEIANGFVIA